MRIFRTAVPAFLLLVTINLSAQVSPVERLESIVTTLASDEFMGRGFGSDGGRMAATYIKGQFTEAGIDPFMEGYYHKFDHRYGILNITGYNIVGVIEGSDPKLKEEYIVIGAHYDHLGWEVLDNDTLVYNGADDNASGVASIIELGRMLSENREQLGRSVIIVAFDGEENGLLGSKAFVNELITGPYGILDKESVVAMFSLDMVGMYSDNYGVDFLGIEMFEDYESLLDAAYDHADIDINKTNDRIPDRTDTAPFGKIGIPSVHVFTGMGSPYHQPEDDSDLLDYEGMYIITDYLWALVTELSVKDEISSTKKFEAIVNKGPMKYFNPGITVNIGGTQHNYKNDFYKAKAVFAYGAGISLQTRVSQWLSIQPEIVYEWSGSQVAGGKLRTHALTVPVSLLITSPDEEGYGVRAFYQVGGYYSYAFGGNDRGTALDLTNDYNATDYGLVFGFGLEIMNFRMGYMFKRSMTDFTINDVPDQDVRLNGSFLKIGWAF